MKVDGRRGRWRPRRLWMDDITVWLYSSVRERVGLPWIDDCYETTGGGRYNVLVKYGL